MQPATQSNIDYAVQAKTALAAVERLSAEIEAIQQKTATCREKWRDYGAALLAQRVLMPSNQQFGQWVKEHGLDAGLAAQSQTRSDAIWLAEHWNAIFDIVENGTYHHPTNIRQQCRAAGHDWAGETQHEKARKEQSRRTKAKRKQYSWQRVAEEEGVTLFTSDSQRVVIRQRLQEIDPSPDLFTAQAEQQLRAALVKYVAQKQPESVSAVVEEARTTVNESARERFDKAVARITAALEGAYNAKMRALQASYEDEIRKGIEARIGPELEEERKRAREMFERNRRAMSSFIARRDGIKLAMTKDDWRLVLNCLHPDRAPADRQEKFAEAFGIVKKLQGYLES